MIALEKTMPRASEYSFFPRPVPVQQRQWGNISLLQELGSGCNGTLFLAHDGCGAIVAAIAASMDHPNIAAVHELASHLTSEVSLLAAAIQEVAAE